MIWVMVLTSAAVVLVGLGLTLLGVSAVLDSLADLRKARGKP